jgi:hypothetical protein
MLLAIAECAAVFPVVRGFDVPESVVSRLLTMPRIPFVESRILAAFNVPGARWGGALQFLICLIHVCAPLFGAVNREAVRELRRAHKLATVAQCMGRSLATIRSDLKAAGLPGPAKLRALIITLYALWLVEHEGYTFDQAARALGLGDGGRLTKLTRKYVGETPTGLRASKGFDGVLGELLSGRLPGAD